MSQMNAATSLADLASTGGATNHQSAPPVGIVGMTKAAVESTRSFVGRALEFVGAKAASAQAAAVGKGRTASAFVVGGLNDVKARSITARDQAKKAVADQVASVNSKALAMLEDAKARVVTGCSTMQQSALGYIPAGFRAQLVLVHGYTTEKFLLVKGIAASLSDSTRERVLTQVTSAQIMTMNTIETAKTQAAHLGDVVVQNTPIRVKTGVTTAYNSAAINASAAHQTIVSVGDRAVDFSKTKVSEANTAVREVASDPKAKSAALGAAGGAVTIGATGGAVGLASGSVAGAVLGLVPAIFTFGLSIPVGAVLGGGAGLCVGTAVGGTTGLVAGGAAGYKKDSISSSTKNVMAQAGDCAQYAKEKANASRQFVLDQASPVRARVRAMISGTGGTEFHQKSD